MKIPGVGGWAFEDAKIASAFDDHVREQLPWYDLATGIVSHIIRHYLPRGGVIYDIGAATGNITRSVRDTIKHRGAKVIAIEPSKEMVDVYNGEGTVIQELAEEHEYTNFDVAVLFLTVMFIPIPKRDALISSLVDKCNPGGCIIIFDKDEPKSGYLSTVISRLSIAGKIASGVSADEVIKKELSLSGCQRPYRCAVEGAVEVFRFGDFAGYIIEVR